MKDNPPEEAAAKLGRRAVFSKHGTRVHRIPTCNGTKLFWPQTKQDVIMMAFKIVKNKIRKRAFSLKVSVCDNRIHYYNKQVRIQNTSD
jgi:hypothetical protein